jgi:hypothetical protein
MKLEIRKTGNEYYSEITWELFVNARARTVVQELAKEVDKTLGKSKFRACNV